MGKLKCEIVFLVLHYGDVKLTQRAVSSLMCLDRVEKSRIIIVENGSRNNSDEELKRVFRDTENVDVVISSANLGFSRGNNLGYQHLKVNYDPDFLVVMNNDILFPNAGFISDLYKSYDRESFYVSGPDVFVPQRLYHSSPLRASIPTIDEIGQVVERNRAIIAECQKRCSLMVMKQYVQEILLANSKLPTYKAALRNLIRRNKRVNQLDNDYFCLQGSCLIFDRRFICSNDHVFMPETFLYAEEFILAERCRRNGWKMRYIPDIRVHHTCQGSLKVQNPSLKEYKRKVENSAKYSIEAMNIFLEYYLARE